jgi:hypothetical protein
MLPARDASKGVPEGLHIKHRGRDDRTVVLDFHGDFQYKPDDSWFPPLHCPTIAAAVSVTLFSSSLHLPRPLAPRSSSRCHA